MEKSKLMMIAIIALLVVLLLTIGAGFFLIFKNINKNSSEAEENKEPVKQENIELIQYDDSIYTNLRTGDDGKDHVVRLGFSLGIDATDTKQSEAFKLQLADKTPIVKDVIIGVLRNKTFEELQKSDAQSVLREEILEKLQQEFETNLIVTVYLSDLFLN